MNNRSKPETDACADCDFDELARRHKDAVYRQMVRVCGNREDAEDVLIEALLKAYRSLDALTAREAFRTWLARIASRVCWQLRRRESLLPLLQLSALQESGADVPDPSPSVEAQAGSAQLKQILRDALNSLPPAYREVYQLRAIHELSGEETARRLNLTLPAMKSRWHRARTLLRAHLDRALTPQQAPISVEPETSEGELP
ncbi:sigma-70 family RNA polymerase sigma factor [Acidobacteria bacterium AB60]|nr:sigma-70 family RNA polymerase sigma factor [Acidobacteria bacterium AB60]